jgi:insertion element IS1 protein InsB
MGAKGLWDSLPPVYRQCAVCDTDSCEAYHVIFPAQRHKAVGKKSGKTNKIERLNCTLRQRVSRLVRKTLSFSKSIENHIGAIWCFIQHDSHGRGQRFPTGQSFRAQQILIQQRLVSHDPQRHVSIHPRLKFQQQIHIQPSLTLAPILPAHPSDQIIRSVAQIIADMQIAQLFQSGEIESRRPRLVDEAPQQILSCSAIRALHSIPSFFSR